MGMTEQQSIAPTVEDNSQQWKGMDGSTAWHLIDRHADNWADVGKMMDEWLKENSEAPIAQHASAPSEQKLECPYPCGWENLYSLIVSNGALIVRSIDPDSVSESTWAAISNTIEHAKDLCKHGMLPSAAPQTDYKAQRDALLDFANHIATSPKLVGTGWQEMAQTVVASVKGG